MTEILTPFVRALPVALATDSNKRTLSRDSLDLFEGLKSQG